MHDERLVILEAFLSISFRNLHYDRCGLPPQESCD
jgi:hypothetical protein